ncbi:Protein roadkill [Frankliniella fusca]|uniref:Protein roadkill n=1 Tax=Frankliniella fusca TaxID=407009 RepID=A0AAE1LPM7_9NEOP|nr:Protein roadkill [Frankliniella fusca]
MTLPEPSPRTSKVALSAGSEDGEVADDESTPTTDSAPPPTMPPDPPPTMPPAPPPTESPASRSTSLSGSRRTSDGGFGLGFADKLFDLADRLGCDPGGGGDLGDDDPLFSRRSSSSELSGPMKDIMDGATIPTVPRYIFKAHEITADVRKLLKKCLHTDVILAAADEEYPAHSKILKVYGGALHEMAERSGPDGRVALADMSGEVLYEVLRYVYTRTAPAAERMPRALLAAAHRAGLPGLKERCAEVLVQRLDVHNVTEMFELADNNAEERLKQAAAVMFLENAKEIYDTEEWHASLDLRPAAAMRLVHIAVTKTTKDYGSMSTGTRIVHVIARIYMVAIVPVIGYVLYASVRNKIRAARGLDGNGTASATGTTASAAAPATAAEVVADLVNATVQQTVAMATGVEEDEFFTSANDEL